MIYENKRASVNPPYTPMDDSTYMSEQMLNYFQDKLINWQKMLTQIAQDVPEQLVDTSVREADPVDNSINKEINYPQVACIEHKKMLLDQIEMALKSIKNGTYGFCEHTGKHIGVARLDSYPIARLCVKAQELCEKKRAFKPSQYI
jgi:DnaK suppressor protein